MGIFFIHSPNLNAQGRNYCLPFECGANSVADLVGKLNADLIVAGYKLMTLNDGRGGKIIDERIPVAVTAKGIATVTDWEGDIVEDRDPVGILRVSDMEAILDQVVSRFKILHQDTQTISVGMRMPEWQVERLLHQAMADDRRKDADH